MVSSTTTLTRSWNFKTFCTGRFSLEITCRLPEDKASAASVNHHPCPTFANRLHGIIIVVMANDPRLTGGILEKYLTPVREILSKTGKLPPHAFTIYSTVVSEYLISLYIMHNAFFSCYQLRNRTCIKSVVIESLNSMMSNSIDMSVSLNARNLQGRILHNESLMKKSQFSLA